MFYWLRKSYYWSDYLQLSCQNRSVKSVIGRSFLVCLLCTCECHDVTAHDVMTTTSKMNVTARDVMTTTFCSHWIIVKSGLHSKEYNKVFILLLFFIFGTETKYWGLTAENLFMYRLTTSGCGHSNFLMTSKHWLSCVNTSVTEHEKRACSDAFWNCNKHTKVSTQYSHHKITTGFHYNCIIV